MNTTEILDQIDGALGDWTVGPDAMRCNAPADVVATRRPVTRPGAGLATVAITIDVSGYVAAMARAAESVARVMAIADGQALRALKALAVAFAGQRDEHHPPPLCIDGHAYHRRARARRRRR